MGRPGEPPLPTTIVLELHDLVGFAEDAEFADKSKEEYCFGGVSAGRAEDDFRGPLPYVPAFEFRVFPRITPRDRS